MSKWQRIEREGITELKMSENEEGKKREEVIKSIHNDKKITLRLSVCKIYQFG